MSVWRLLCFMLRALMKSLCSVRPGGESRLLWKKICPALHENSGAIDQGNLNLHLKSFAYLITVPALSVYIASCWQLDLFSWWLLLLFSTSHFLLFFISHFFQGNENECYYLIFSLFPSLIWCVSCFSFGHINLNCNPLRQPKTRCCLGTD